MKNLSHTRSGFTLLELMVAIFIFFIVEYTLFHGIITGDKIRGKANISRTAAILASNEAERVRSAALRGIEIQDSAYTETVSGFEYKILRTNINPPDIVIENKTYTELEIRVEPQSALASPYVFKFLQGYHQ